MVIKELIKNKEDEFDKLCKEHSVKTIFAFGSSVTGNFDVAIHFQFFGRSIGANTHIL